MSRLRISGIVEESIVDGPGLRYVVFTQGCPHHCPGCHNPQTHDFDGGEFRDTDDVSGHKGCAQCLSDNSIAAEYSQIIGHPASFDDFARDARANKPQATNLVNRTCFRLGTLVATIANLAMPDKIMIAGESSFIAKFGIDDLRNGINMYRHSQAAPVDFEIPDHDWALWAKAAASQAIRQYVG